MKAKQITNEDIVLLLIKKGTEYGGAETKGIMGKKALQKSLYFFNQTRNVFNFRWGDYGPLSGEIQHIAEDLIVKGNVAITSIPTRKEGAVIQQMQYCAEEDSPLEELDIPKDLDKGLDEIVRFVAGKSPRSLELLASVHYWAVRQQELLGEYSLDYIYEKLNELKPDAGFTNTDVESAINTLENQGYIRRSES